ncbi:MAG TPA: hypothetical protein VMA36_01895 [Candidatus Limnocylindria bacterium]|jgi:hypothetical protein|nr:hypothetical protein [Candidatus Limnocylindria bacterium]
MNTILRREGVIDCPFSVGFDYVEEFVAERCDRGGILLRMPLFGGAIPLPATTCVAARPDLSEWGKPHDELMISVAPPASVCTRLELRVRFRIARLRTRLLLEARYRPRFGELGALLDRAIGRHFLNRILDDLLARMSLAAEERERRYRIAFPPVFGPVRTDAACAAAQPGFALR